MPRATANDVDLYYELFGAGRPTLFFNGTGSSVESSRLLIEAIGKDVRLAAHDQRGLGKTTAPPPPWTMADYAADGLALMDHLGWDRCAVIGVSFGGMVAQELAVTAPERVERLALLCTSPGGAGGSSYPLHELTSMSEAERIATRTQLVDTRFTPEWLAEHPAEKALVDFMAEREALPRDVADEAGVVAQMAARKDHDVYERLDRITCPTFVACGRTDGIAPMSNSEAIVARVAGAELHVYDGGHLFFLQDRSALPEVVAFLQATD